MNMNIEDFLNSDTQIALVESQRYDIAISNIFNGLSTYFDKGIIYTNSNFKELMDNLKLIQDLRLSSYNITSKQGNTINGIEMKYNHYNNIKTQKPNIGNAKTFSIYFPIHSVINNEKECEVLLNTLNQDNSSKIFLITLNSINNNKLKKEVDKIISI